ncbi:MAG: phenylalanine--tRNA ligase subunit alpha [Nanoarchaeota archaeon]|nr:phenylalanine--tRNA ligase subunit alpha [Nanoarchaeota archaeon]MBU1004346.1 phenylalanine--tRNA ligase subunit alpha [Nanoarchaeota archaeon]MBU1946303.1 phenylalanine--tRNA ligase subunit alpha [Nanoarchaeota archaeon]
MDEERLAQTLHNYERKVLSVLDKESTVSEISSKSGLKDIEVMRGLQWLENKGIVKLREDVKEIVELDSNGEKYREGGLPERRFLKFVKKDTPVSEILKEAKLSNEEVSVCLGVLKGKAAIAIRKDKELMVSILPQGEKILQKESLEELFLKKKFPILLSELTDEDKFALDSLRKRKNIVKVETRKIRKAELTEFGRKLSKSGIKFEETYDRLTPAMVRDGSWANKKFRRYDVKINVPLVFGGKKQHYARFLDDVRGKFISLGFSEMFGPIVETEFWDMDALFMPQFHSARDIHAAYYVKEPKYGKLDNYIVERVKESHEIGKGTISKGWQYKFDVNKTKQLILRTQGTALSARMLASKELKIPGKYFGIARCFRPDVVDATHSADFNQVEGIVIEEGLNFRHLKGLLKMFAEEFAETDQIKITPAYFPFTEPSAELHAKHPELGWIELGGSGIFRPELVKPLLGREISVLAWGLGIDRLAMFKLGIKDIRELFSHNLDFLKDVKVV